MTQKKFDKLTEEGKTVLTFDWVDDKCVAFGAHGDMNNLLSGLNTMILTTMLRMYKQTKDVGLIKSMTNDFLQQCSDSVYLALNTIKESPELLEQI